MLWKLNFVAIGFLFGAIIITLIKLFYHSPVSCMVITSCIISVRPSSPTILSTTPGTLSSSVAFLIPIFFKAFSSSLCKI